MSCLWTVSASYFYPRPPGGGRHKDLIRAKLEQIISIHALRVEGDERSRATRAADHISIHALRVEGDVAPSLRAAVLDNFYPRPPGGGRPT